MRLLPVVVDLIVVVQPSPGGGAGRRTTSSANDTGRDVMDDDATAPALLVSDRPWPRTEGWVLVWKRTGSLLVIGCGDDGRRKSYGQLRPSNGHDGQGNLLNVFLTYSSTQIISKRPLTRETRNMIEWYDHGCQWHVPLPLSDGVGTFTMSRK